MYTCKRKAFITFIIFTIVSIIVISCKNGNDAIFEPSQKIVSFGDNGGTKSIQMPEVKNWGISYIIDKTNNDTLYGNKYVGYPEKEMKNVLLQLSDNEFGRLEYDWATIERYGLGTLQITMPENLSPFSRKLIITLYCKDQKEDIVVNEEKGESYTFEKIAYSLEKENGISYIWENGGQYDYSNAFEKGYWKESKTLSIKPLEKIYSWYSFYSDDKSAFSWVRDSNPTILFPHGENNGKLYFNEGEVIEYTSQNTSLSKYYSKEYNTGTTTDVKFTPQQSKCHFLVEMQKLSTTYTITIKNKESTKEKAFQGKFVSMVPTGKFEIIWDY